MLLDQDQGRKNKASFPFCPCCPALSHVHLWPHLEDSWAVHPLGCSIGLHPEQTGSIEGPELWRFLLHVHIEPPLFTWGEVALRSDLTILLFISALFFWNIFWTWFDFLWDQMEAVLLYYRLFKKDGSWVATLLVLGRIQSCLVPGTSLFQQACSVPGGFSFFFFFF